MLFIHKSSSLPSLVHSGMKYGRWNRFAADGTGRFGKERLEIRLAPLLNIFRFL